MLNDSFKVGINNLLESDRKNIWHPFSPLITDEPPIFISSAKGIYLHTDDGKKIIDAISSWWVNLHGHSHDEIARAISEQATMLEHVIFAGFTHEPAIRLSESLLKILPSSMSKIFFSDDGSTAVEVALKIAIQFWHNQGKEKKTRIIAIDGAYHGDTFGSMSVGERSIFTAPFTKYLFDVKHIDFPTGENQRRVRKQFEDLISEGNVAAFIYEPLVQGAAGMRMYDSIFLNDLISLARGKDILCIADEVFTGFGRTGKLFASDHMQSKPDIMALSKGITGGTLPLGVTACSEKIISAFESDETAKIFFHGHSFTANPLACAAANASMKLLMKEECQQQIAMITAKHSQFASSIKSDRAVKVARVTGTILAIELNTAESTSYTNNIRKKSYRFFLDRGILLRPLGNIIYLVPPYVITAAELDFIYESINSFLRELNAVAP